MENTHLSRRADSAKSSVEDVINDLIVEVEELEEAKSALENKLEISEERVRELENDIQELTS